MKSHFDLKRLFAAVPKVTPGEGKFSNSYGKTRAIFIEGEPYNGKPTSVFCYIGIPNKPEPAGGFPGVVLAHGAGGCAFYEWIEFWNKRGYAAIAPDFSGKEYGSRKLDGPAGEGIIRINPGARPANYGSVGENGETFYNSWIYHSVSSIILAHNLLLADSAVNPHKTVMTGISWGAVLTCIAAGVDDRFCAFAPVYGAGYLYYDQCINIKDKSETELKNWVEYYDPCSYLTENEKPILFTVGVDDPAFSLYANTKSSELCRGKVYYSNRSSLTHYHRWTDNEGMAVIGVFLDSVVNDIPLPFSVMSAEVSGNMLMAEIEGFENVKDIKFCYTLDSSADSREWKWHSENVRPCDDGTVVCEIPAKTAACFLELSDKGTPELILSTKAFFI